MHPKSFYITYQANNEMFEVDEILIAEVLKVKPFSVLDFGTGTGKNIRTIREINPAVVVCGIDLSFLNIVHARAKNDIPFLIIGDESHLCRLCNFDVVMTCSVLCHIQDITDIIEEFKRIAQYSIIIAETTDEVGEFYYAHDYIALGFEDLALNWYSEENKATYKIYKWNKQ